MQRRATSKCDTYTKACLLGRNKTVGVAHEQQHLNQTKKKEVHYTVLLKGSDWFRLTQPVSCHPLFVVRATSAGNG